MLCDIDNENGLAENSAVSAQSLFCAVVARPRRVQHTGCRSPAGAVVRDLSRNAVLSSATERDVPSISRSCRVFTVSLLQFSGKRLQVRNRSQINTDDNIVLLNGRCTSLLRVVVSEMTYTVSSGTLNSTIPYCSQGSSLLLE